MKKSILRLAGAGFVLFLIAFLRIANSNLQILLPHWLLLFPLVSLYANEVLVTKMIENSLKIHKNIQNAILQNNKHRFQESLL